MIGAPAATVPHARRRRVSATRTAVRLLAVVAGAAVATVPVAIAAAASASSPSPTTAGDDATSTTAAAAVVPRTNRLIHETSPYLLQHAHNPVDWFPWGDEAFAKARQENKPVFLSVGYSTCYWCHVMEKESFEDVEVARVLNEKFVAIKVDREERPDVDEHFLRVTQLLTGQAGWPNSVWLTSDGAPWMATAYLPRAKFLAQLHRAAEQWYAKRDGVHRRARTLAASLERAGADRSGPAGSATAAATPSADMVEAIVARMARAFDPVHGGWRGAPKFPPHGALALFLRHDSDTADPATRAAIVRTLDTMLLGGIHDHVGGGFHRYATDERWLVPHFEKMLFDNAQLLRACADAYALTGYTRYRDAVADIFGWVQREMTSPEGAFYAALDAGGMSREGEAYVWRVSQVIDVLGPEDGQLFAEIYQFESRGNFAEESTGRRRGTNIPHLRESIEAVAARRGEDPAELNARLASLRGRLLAHRQSWPQPRRDDKVIASWNGLMIAALARAGRQLAEPRHVESATRAAEFLRRHLITGDELLRTHRRGEARLPGLLEDYAYVADAFLELHRTTNDPAWLGLAEQLATTMLRDFEDLPNGGFFASAGDHDGRIPRSKDLRGSSNLPDADGVAIGVLLDLAQATGREEFTVAARRALASLAPRWREDPSGSEHALVAAIDLLRAPAPPERSVASTDAGAPAEIARRADVVTIRARASTTHVRPDTSFNILLTLEIDPGWHLYGDNEDATFLVPVEIAFDPVDGLRVDAIEPPAPLAVFDPVLNQTVNTYSGRVTFRLRVSAAADAPRGPRGLNVRIVTQACDDSRCLAPQTTHVPISVTLESGSAPK